MGEVHDTIKIQATTIKEGVRKFILFAAICCDTIWSTRNRIIRQIVHQMLLLRQINKIYYDHIKYWDLLVNCDVAKRSSSWDRHHHLCES